MNRFRSLHVITGCWLSLSLAPHAMAASMADTFQVHGFMSQALILTDHNDFFGPSSEGGGSWEYTELGLNGSFRPRSDVLIAAQVLSRQAGDIQRLDEVELDYGIVDYQFLSRSDLTSGIQLGRFKNPLGLYNQSRDVAATRPSILLPQSIYFDRTRMPALSADGAMGYVETLLDDSSLRLQVGVGRPRLDRQSEITALGRSDLGDYSGDQSYIGQIRYERSGGKIVAALTYAEVNASLDSDVATVGSGNYAFRPWLFSLQYNQEDWSVTGEYAIRHVDASGFGERRDYAATGDSWYVQFLHRLASDWQWLLRYDSLVIDRNDPSGRDYEKATGRPDYSRYAKDWTVGLQWKPHSHFMLSSEFHKVEGTGWLPFDDSAELNQQKKNWNMLLFQVSYFF